MEEPRSYEALLVGDDLSGRSRWPEGLSRALMWRRMVVVVEREPRACGSVGCLMPEIFSLVGRSG